MTDPRQDEVLVDRDDAVALVTINRPSSHNSLNAFVRRELPRVIDELCRDGRTRVVVLRGAGRRAFASGADLAELVDLNEDSARAHLREFDDCLTRVERAPLPVIAMIEGYALGGGCELAAACDLRIASDQARLGIPIARIGHTLDLANARRLTGLIGVARLKELLLTDRMIDAHEAERIGLLHRVVPSAQLRDFTLSMARTIAAKAPLSVRGSKAVLQWVTDHPSAAPDEDNAGFAAPLFDTRDFKEGVRALLEKREPRFSGS